MSEFGQWVYDAAEAVLSILPDSPFAFLEDYVVDLPPEWLRWLNWFVPIGTIIGILGLWCTAILTYYVYQIVLRWAKAIE